ncbi:ssDNA-binding transcriptional regulator [Neoconidiobolus thromboides FSU 785]|nr:ssDNA-binding transcriptional regulator [Neoconidiobolus thromboides FSU 785]
MTIKELKKSEEEHSGKENFKKQKESNDVTFSKNDDGEYYMDLPNSKKRLSVRTFKGNTYIDIREFYTDKNGNLAPGKKGISLKVDEYKAIKKHLDDIDKCIDDVEK